MPQIGHAEEEGNDNHQANETAARESPRNFRSKGGSRLGSSVKLFKSAVGLGKTPWKKRRSSDPGWVPTASPALPGSVPAAPGGGHGSSPHPAGHHHAINVFPLPGIVVYWLCC